MATPRELRASELYRRCDPARFEFETTVDLDPPPGPIGQPRALAALELGVEIDSAEHNVFVHGAPGTGRHAATRELLRERAGARPVPDDCCYVNNFAEPKRPALLRLPAGRGRALRTGMEKLIADLGTVLRSAFESEEYQGRRKAINDDVQERQQQVVGELAKEAGEHGIAMVRTPLGVGFAPQREGEVLDPDEFEKLPDEEKRRLRTEIEGFEARLAAALRKAPAIQREARDRVSELNREISRFAVGPLIDELRAEFEDLPAVLAHLDAVEREVLDNAHGFLGASGDDGAQQAIRALVQGGGDDDEEPFTRRFQVNLIVDHAETAGAPVIEEPHPSLPNLVGRVEHVSRMGSMTTDFSLIRAGALHRANGGFLIVDALKLLQQPQAWDALKRALRAKRIEIESLGETLGLVSTISVEPDPMPLAVRVVLVGSPLLYHLLRAHDAETRTLFKIAADFDARMDRDGAAEQRYAGLVARLAARHGTPAFDRGAVARVVEAAARFAGDATALSLVVDDVADVVREAGHLASQRHDGAATAADVEAALDAREHRSDRLRRRLLDETLRGTLLVSTDGVAEGQVNGLSVIDLGGFAFGRPSRITARVRLGKGEVIDIEREVELGGKLHSKGVLILAGLLGARYSGERPLTLSASLVFEQSYGGVDGDSASSAEYYALLSAIAEIPIRQELAVTGSINQQGEIQAVGGVDEKIEGFYDLCRARGLTGDQGVLIPAANASRLMLAGRVREAVERGAFHVWPVTTADEGIELLTGVDAGDVHERVERRLAALAEAAKAFSRPGG